MHQNNLRRLREAAGLTLEDLAAKVGVTNAAISHIEQGRNYGRRETRWAIVRALDLPYLAVFPIEAEEPARKSDRGAIAA